MSKPQKPPQWAIDRARRRLTATAEAIGADPALAADLTSDQRVTALATEIHNDCATYWRSQIIERNTN